MGCGNKDTELVLFLISGQFYDEESTAVGQAVACVPVMQRTWVRSPVGISFLGEVFSGFFLICKTNVRNLWTHKVPKYHLIIIHSLWAPMTWDVDALWNLKYTYIHDKEKGGALTCWFPCKVTQNVFMEDLQNIFIINLIESLIFGKPINVDNPVDIEKIIALNFDLLMHFLLPKGLGLFKCMDCCLVSGSYEKSKFCHM